jgi:HNH endonuclease/helix-turn-helix protein
VTDLKYTPKVIARFWVKVAITANPDKCWEWQAFCSKYGYGQFYMSWGYRRPNPAHRVAWEITNGEIPDGLWVLHKCDNRRCVNPEHLFLGTPKENTQDMIQKGRRVAGRYPQRGELSRTRKLSQSQVDYIRQRYALGDISQKQLGLEIGVDQSTISVIVNGKRW